MQLVGWVPMDELIIFASIGNEDPNSAGARRVMSSSGRLTRTVALDKLKDKT